MTAGSAPVVMVTGAARNIGFAVASHFAAAGYSVVVNGRGEDTVNAAVERLRATGATACAAVGDVGDEAHVEQMFTTAERAFGPVSILINTAGLRCHDAIVDTQLRDWEEVLRATLTGTFLTTRRALPGMFERGWGRIVNFAGLSAQSGATGRAAVVAAKSGIMGLTKASALEAAPHGVTVNAISPGFIDTDRPRALGADQGAAEEHFRRGRNTPVGRVGRPEDIASMCAYLCSEAAGYITGQTVSINGGVYP